MRNLILTILHQYHYPVVEPFIKSLKACEYDADLVIFVSDTTSKLTQQLLRKEGAVLIPYSQKFPFIEKYTDTFQNITPSITINNYRFLFYLQYLTDHLTKYDMVMLTDIRDVVFQKNIFNSLKKDDIYFFLEDRSQTFRSSELNYEWCLMANDSEISEQIIDRNVSCAGTTVGGCKSILAYLKYMQDKFKHREELVWGLDQGLHNAYVHTITPANAVLVPNTFPLILTLGACSNYTTDNNGLLCNESREPYAVVHQWDRFGSLLLYFKKKYVGVRPLQLLKKLVFEVFP